MKRLMSLLLLAMVSLSVYAQKNGNVSAGYIHKEVTIIEKQKQKKEFQKFDAKRGLTHIVEFHPKIYFGKDHISLSYIAGWRFNNWLLAGVGTGIDFATNVEKGLKDKIGTEQTIYGEYYHGSSYEESSLNGISIPLYAHAKFYFMRTRWSPYSSVSLGGRLAPKDCGAYFDLSVGVNYLPSQSFTDKYKISGFFAAIGYSVSGFESVWCCNHVESYGYRDKCSDSSCPYVATETSHHHSMLDYRNYRDAFHGMSLRIGVSF